MKNNANNEGGGKMQILVFRLDREEYGIDIINISTIIEKDMGIARVPKTLSYVKGVINLRGEILPVIDLRIKLEYAEAEYDSDTRIIIVKSEDISVGLIVDAVVEVVQVTQENIESAVNVSDELSSDVIYGICKLNDRVITVLNADRFINID